ncbi:MAG: hypothetical protein JXR10_15925 [Cyclobacteriaceae bacterium]
MSSHHIVRDQQEPALFIGGLEGLPWEQLQDLLEWSPTVLCTQNCLQTYIDRGHKVDVALVSDDQFEEWESKLNGQMPVNFLKGESNEFVSLGLAFLKNEGHQSVNIFCLESERETYLKLLDVWLEFFEIVIFTEKGKTIVQKNPLFKKWVPAGSAFHVILRKGATLDFNNIEKVSESATSVNFLKREEGEFVIKCIETPYFITEPW